MRGIEGLHVYRLQRACGELLIPTTVLRCRGTTRSPAARPCRRIVRLVPITSEDETGKKPPAINAGFTTPPTAHTLASNSPEASWRSTFLLLSTPIPSDERRRRN
jgi:hypothetical protein